MNEKEIEEIRKSADIVDIISSYITLTPKGKNYFGVCPFHDDHSPSMSVSKEKQLYKCFSCGAGGNVFNFVKEYENVNFLEAVNIIAQKIGKSFTYKASKSTINEEEYKTMNLAMVYFQNNLQSLEAKEARKYLEERNIDDEFIKQFHLGFSFQGGKLLEFFNQKKYQPEYLKELGLLNEHDNNYYDVFQNRLIFPILNENGEVVSFIGRVIEKDKTPKYLNSKETKIFKKGHILYNYYIAKEKVRLLKKIIIVEGIMDAMRMTMNGFPNTIALMGTALTKEQIELIKKLHVPVTLMLDNDEAGQKNTYQNGLLLEEANLDINVVRLSKAKDPDEYLVKYGKEAMQEVLNHPISFLEFKLNYLKENKIYKIQKN